jgi:photosystem II stability/assembly factor-like uncharacterized protein
VCCNIDGELSMGHLIIRTAAVGRKFRSLALALPLLIVLPCSGQFTGGGGGGGGAGGDVAKFMKELRQLPALHLASPTHAGMMSAATAGKRIVAVGDHGTVLLSDDDGKTWRQARDVPTRVVLTSVSFVDDKQGWVAGHWGVVLHTEDGGETWKLQRQDISVDQPLFSIYFSDRNNGLAVGLWSLALRTTDGGATWTAVKVPAPSGADKTGPNLYEIFTGKGGAPIFVAAELGVVYRSDDGGQSFSMIMTGNRGSLWAGLCLQDGSLLVAGLNGKLLRSTDGKTWAAVESGVTGSITDLAQAPDGRVIGVGLEGSVISSKDGVSFTATPRPDRASLTAVLVTAQGSPLLFSKDGVVESN